jgi:hypothetical protein
VTCMVCVAQHVMSTSAPDSYGCKAILFSVLASFESGALVRRFDQLPSLDVLAMLCTQLVHDERYEAAASHFAAAARMQPGEPKWALMEASCHVRGGHAERALELYEQVRLLRCFFDQAGACNVTWRAPCQLRPLSAHTAS